MIFYILSWVINFPESRPFLKEKNCCYRSKVLPLRLDLLFEKESKMKITELCPPERILIHHRTNSLIVQCTHNQIGFIVQCKLNTIVINAFTCILFTVNRFF